uniref:MFS domain-containing protein n=1 Tax=Loa loa TaxID=7209 RepID=A0A1I7VRH7_LOALO
MDTPRWLIKKGKGDEASKAAVYIRKWDEKLTPEREEEIVAVVQDAAKEERLETRQLCSCVCDKFSTSFISYGIAYNMDALAGTVYINVIILGAARWAINISAAGLEFSIQSVGRRLLHLVAVGFIVVIMGIIFVIYLLTWPRIDTYKAVVKAGGIGEGSIHAIIMFTRYASLLAAAMCTELFVLDAVQPTELFPTPVRSAGIAFIQTFNRLGTIVSPLVFIPSKHWPPAPFLLMLITSAADFLLYFFLVPETRGKKLPDNMPGEEHTVHNSHTQSSDPARDAKIEGQDSARKITSSTSRQDEKGTKRETKKKTDGVKGNKGDEKESSSDGRKSEEKKRKEEDKGDGEEMGEKKEGEKQQKSTEGSKPEKSTTESRKSEERREK